MTEKLLPFTPADQKFGETLAHGFVKPAITWMLAQRGSETATSPSPTIVEEYSIWWATPLFLECFLNAHDVQNLFTVGEKKILADQATRLAKLLISNQKPDGYWDQPNSIWDTSAICRALMLFVQWAQSAPNVVLTEGVCEQVEKAVSQSLRWLTVKCLQWEDSPYTFGPDDLAWVIRLLCQLERRGYQSLPPDLASHVKFTSPRGLPKTIKQLMNTLVEILLRRKTIHDRGPQSIQAVSWDTAFPTAEILRAFCEAVPLLEGDLKKETLTAIAGTVAFLEEDQQEGKWGLPNTTAVVLEAYLRACTTLAEYEGDGRSALKPDLVVVFQALRWLAVQANPDGSILHSFHHTAFFTLMLQYLMHSQTELLDMSVLELYDYVAWGSQNRFTQERGERLRQADRLVRRTLELAGYIRLYNALMAAARVFLVLTSAWIVILVFARLDWLHFTLNPWSVKLNSSEAVVATTLAYIPLVSGFWVYSRRWARSAAPLESHWESVAYQTASIV